MQDPDLQHHWDYSMAHLKVVMSCNSINRWTNQLVKIQPYRLAWVTLWMLVLPIPIQLGRETKKTDSVTPRKLPLLSINSKTSTNLITRWVSTSFQFSRIIKTTSKLLLRILWKCMASRMRPLVNYLKKWRKSKKYSWNYPIKSKHLL